MCSSRSPKNNTHGFFSCRLHPSCLLTAFAVPLGKVDCRAAARRKGQCPQRRAFAESGVANVVFLHDPSREKAILENPQIFQNCEIINNLSADYGQSKAEAIPNRPACPQPCISSHKGVYWGKKEAFAMWFVYALGSAVFAALTSILAKIGIEGVNSTLATAIRTAVVLLMSWGMVFLTGTQTGIAEISRRSWLFLVLSGLATGASWLCYYHALQVGAASKVVPIDKLSVVITLALAFVVLHEPFTAKSFIGCALITAGTLFMVL